MKKTQGRKKKKTAIRRRRKPWLTEKKIGSGKVPFEAKMLAHDLIRDPEYQKNLLLRLEQGVLHPSLEKMLWEYSEGKPKQTLDVNTNFTMELANRMADARRRVLGKQAHDNEDDDTEDDS